MITSYLHQVCKYFIVFHFLRKISFPHLSNIISSCNVVDSILVIVYTLNKDNYNQIQRWEGENKTKRLVSWAEWCQAVILDFSWAPHKGLRLKFLESQGLKQLKVRIKYIKDNITLMFHLDKILLKLCRWQRFCKNDFWAALQTVAVCYSS